MDANQNGAAPGRRWPLHFRPCAKERARDVDYRVAKSRAKSAGAFLAKLLPSFLAARVANDSCMHRTFPRIQVIRQAPTAAIRALLQSDFLESGIFHCAPQAVRI